MPNQRDVMRRLFREHRGNEEEVVRAYAETERRGHVPRLSNKHDIDAVRVVPIPAFKTLQA